ncbi:hypothetical protein JCM8547_000573 [Rhodosporidiobolus lusitaniae]
MSSNPNTYFPNNATAQAALSTLLTLFASRYSPAFLASLVSFWLSQPAPSGRVRGWRSEEAAERVAEKLLEEDCHGRGGREVVAWIEEEEEGRRERGMGGVGEREEVRRRWKGKERATEETKASFSSQGKVKKEDVTLARNLALIRLHTLFPLVPILEIRLLLLSLEHSVFYAGAEELLLRSSSSSSRRPKKGSEGDFAAFGLGIFQALRAVFVPPPPSPSILSSKPTEPLPPDPVLTPHDLFHPPLYISTLTTHFEVLFPSISTGEVERVVREEGGSYTSLRARFELRAAEVAAQKAGLAGGGGGGAGGKGGGGRKWWAFLAGSGGGGGGKKSRDGKGEYGEVASKEEEVGEGMEDVRREEKAREVLRRGGSREAWREREEWEKSTRKEKVRRPMLDGRMTTSTMVPEADEQDLLVELAAEQTEECQCCFSDLPPSSSQLPITCTSSTPQHFCAACVSTYAQTFISGCAPLPSLSLSSFQLPCFAASSSPTHDGSCTGVLSRSTLLRALNRRTCRLLEDRIAAANLELFIHPFPSFSSSSSSAGVTLQRCPFCPYASFSSPSPSSHPLTRAFFPAWMAEPFPPSLLAVLTSIVGAVVLALLTVFVAVVALVVPVEMPRLEKLYVELYPLPSTPSLPRDETDVEATSLAPLPLSTALLLSPYHCLPLSFSYLRSIVARVVRRKEGKKTTFQCLNTGRKRRMGGLGGMGGEGRRRAMEEVEEKVREWVREEEGGEGEEDGENAEEKQERRRRKVIELVWGGEQDEEKEEEEEDEQDEEQEKCGKLSCLLCLSPLNPLAPSLHRCASSSSSSGTREGREETEKEKAEESLRLAVERAMSKAGTVECGRCGAGVVKEGGCNKVTCRCGSAYCWSCRSPIPASVGYRHFCQHFLPDPTQGCTECGRCSLYKETDEKKMVREAAEQARLAWARDHPSWASLVSLDAVVAGPPEGAREESPAVEEAFRRFERFVETVVGALYVAAV